MKVPPSFAGSGPSPSKKDPEKLQKEFEKDAAKALRKFRHAISKAWKKEVDRRTKTSTAEYKKGLSFIDTDDGIEVKMSGWLPNAIEYGANRFDMKPGLLKGRMARTIRLHNGNFRTVSVNSPPNSWIHPGIKPRGIGASVKAQLSKIKEKIIAPLAKKYLGKMSV